MANGTLKRSHDDVSSEGSKRQRLSPQSSTVAGDEPAQFTLHAISTTSPVRKKVDISIRESGITFTNPTTGSVEATVPLTSLRRAFLLPTRGKTKAHWTVVLLSSDTTEKSTAKGAANDSPQIIFGLDATTTAPLTITKQGGEKEVIAKGSPVLPAIRSFLSSLPDSITQLEPSTDVFKSSVNQFGSTVKSASTTGVPGVEAYRAAKVGSLWFMKEGLLWGESKPCEFWALEDLLGPSEGARLSPGSGRVLSITLVRKDQASEGTEEEEESMGIETELSMIDSRERDGISDWIRKHQNMFGRKPGDAPIVEQLKAKPPPPSGPVTIRSLMLDSDSEDEDFVGSSSSGEGSGSDNNNEDSDEDEEEAEGSDGEGDGDGDSDAEIDGEAEGELDPAHHPLLRSGAVPKLSKAAIEMAVGIVEDDLMGGNDDEVDELDD
ncbi:hypothetical protein EST38_g3302 [Candolleomyces aberdarensis]|uniref:Histone chaperone RTT106/FACT complex subunit SPT16-like middle domain-containing protein n=1 Tax=Candolleomyces aberdarensis TaxID=2316362 RepID=A0A4Q2DTE2_9AGAR|nr:hypothetical protein EST38_g3302 [Candolleomyces aberdarensis]